MVCMQCGGVYGVCSVRVGLWCVHIMYVVCLVYMVCVCVACVCGTLVCVWCREGWCMCAMGCVGVVYVCVCGVYVSMGQGGGKRWREGGSFLQPWKLKCPHSLNVYCALTCQVLCKHWRSRNESQNP